MEHCDCPRQQKRFVVQCHTHLRMAVLTAHHACLFWTKGVCFWTSETSISQRKPVAHFAIRSGTFTVTPPCSTELFMLSAFSAVHSSAAREMLYIPVLGLCYGELGKRQSMYILGTQSPPAEITGQVSASQGQSSPTDHPDNLMA